jgi:hypothetical protein
VSKKLKKIIEDDQYDAILQAHIDGLNRRLHEELQPMDKKTIDKYEKLFS